MGGRGGAYRGLAVLTCVVFGACSNMTPNLPLVPAGQKIYIVFPLDSSQPDITVAATTGGTVGTATGAGGAGVGAAASLACGPWIVICFPALAFSGALLGGAAGTAAGMAAGPRRAELEDLQQRMDVFARENDARQQFLEVLTAKAKTRWQLIPDPTPSRVTIHLTSLALQASSEEEVVLAVRVDAVMTGSHEEYMSRYVSASSPPPKTGPVPVSFSGTFNYKGPAASVAQWKEVSGAFLKAALARAYEEIAQQIVSALSGEAGRI
jgi:hypothetical protein